jgi:nucleotide-binding universal stress UspA family protein
MYDEILVPTDGSTGTSAVLDHALAIAADNDARVHGIHVVDRRLYVAASKETKDEVAESLETDGRQALEDLRARVEAAGLDCVTELAEGIPDNRIREYAAEAGVDLIVMGTHGHTGPDLIANLGSTTERVLESAPVPVLVVTMDED